MILAIVIPIKETSHSPTMPVEIYYQLYWLFLAYFSYHVFYQEGLGLFVGIRSQPTSV